MADSSSCVFSSLLSQDWLPSAPRCHIAVDLPLCCFSQVELSCKIPGMRMRITPSQRTYRPLEVNDKPGVGLELQSSGDSLCRYPQACLHIRSESRHRNGKCFNMWLQILESWNIRQIHLHVACIKEAFVNQRVRLVIQRGQFMWSSQVGILGEGLERKEKLPFAPCKLGTDLCMIYKHCCTHRRW